MGDSSIQAITLADVARAAGVSRSTVSKAMHGYASIPASTRQRVLDVAQRLGYRPNPMVASLMAQLRPKRRRQDMQPVIAIVHAWPGSWMRSPDYRGFSSGVAARAKELGFCVEEFRLDAKSDRDARRLERVLQARGIQGILFAQVPDACAELALDISRYSCATLGPSLRFPKAHRASPDLVKAVRLALARARKLGYRRPGFVVDTKSDRRLDRIACGSFLAGWDGSEAVCPPYRYDGDADEGFAAWLAEWRPDFLLAQGCEVWARAEKVAAELKFSMGYAQVGLRGGQEGIAGVALNVNLVGREAIDLIVNQIYLNERGAPEHRKTVLVDPEWVEGASAPPLRPFAESKRK